MEWEYSFKDFIFQNKKFIKESDMDIDEPIFYHNQITRVPLFIPLDRIEIILSSNQLTYDHSKYNDTLFGSDNPVQNIYYNFPKVVFKIKLMKKINTIEKLKLWNLDLI